ncbi:MAG TPA: DUF998 domain-containing protein [Candidatus Dormibacteraeota bacterium]
MPLTSWIGRDATARAAAWAGVACPPAVAAVLLAAGWLSPGYDPVRFTISHLGQRGQPFALEVNLSIAALGLAYVAVAWALDRALGPRARAGAAALAVAGAALVGVALVSRNPAHPIPHRAVALVLFLSLAVAPLLVAAAARREARWRRHAALSLATVAASAAMLVVGGLGVVLGGVPAGAWERVFTGVNLAWLTVVAAGLLRPPSG